MVLGIVARFSGFVAANPFADKHGAKKCPGGCCKDCQVTVEHEAWPASEAKAVSAVRWSDELEGSAREDPATGPLLKEWMRAHDDAEPTKAQATELRKAVNLEKAGNYEGAGKIYEDLKLWHLAGKMRDKDRVQIIKHVTVDTNELIDEIRTGVLAVPYKCHSCGGRHNRRPELHHVRPGVLLVLPDRRQHRGHVRDGPPNAGLRGIQPFSFLLSQPGAFPGRSLHLSPDGIK